MEKIKLGIIELGFRKDADSLTIIEQIINYAAQAEDLGFTRFWLAEHHYYQIKNHPFSNPDILISIIAGMTERIKIGSAGVSLPMYSPYQVVSHYKFLNNIYGGRIDLGLSKGITESSLINNLAHKGLSKENFRTIFNEKLEIISDLLENEDENLKNNAVLIPPYKGAKPDLWYLSTSYNNFNDAIKYKLNYCVSLFHNFGQKATFEKEQLIELKETYFQQNGFYPKVVFSIAVYIADTINKAEAYLKSINKSAQEEYKELFTVVPVTIDSLYDLILHYQLDYGVDEFIIYDVSETNKEKIGNMQAISEKFELLTYAI